MDASATKETGWEEIQETAQHFKFHCGFLLRRRKMVIELDGQYHMNPTNEEKDAARTKKLEELNLKVIRFENRSVFDNLDWVLEEIKKNFRRDEPPRPADTRP